MAAAPATRESEPAPRYDVALSFAGEDREHALALATRLQRAGCRVFYDRFEELWGQDLSALLHEVYDRQTRLAVVFVSQHYLRRPWTQLERRVLVARAMREHGVFLLPVRLDDTELPGLPDVVAYKDWRRESADDVSAALLRLLGERPARSAALRLVPSDFFYAIVHPDDPTVARFGFGCHVVNDTAQARTLQRLEATLTAPGQAGLQFMWRCFYALDARRLVMTGAELTLPLRLEAGQSLLVGVQFVGPRLDPALVWQAGRLRIDVTGWVDAPPRAAAPDLNVAFATDLHQTDLVTLAPWLQPPTAVVAALPAVAFPLATELLSG